MSTQSPSPRKRRRWSVESGGWLVFKLVLGVGWPVAMMINTPARTVEAVTPGSLNVFLIGTLIGGIVSVVGICLTTSTKTRRALAGFSTELVGIVLIAGGAFQYFTLQLGFLVDPEQVQSRSALAVYALAMVLLVLLRGIRVIKDRRARAATLVFQEAA